jgi:hypothetical protein
MCRAIGGRTWVAVWLLGLASCAATPEHPTVEVQSPQPPSTRPATTRRTATRAARPAPVAVAIGVTTAPKGTRLKLASVGEVFFPAYLKRGLEQVDVVVHFHGPPSVVERELAGARLDAVLVTVNYGGLSGKYEKPFSDPKLFGTLLDESMAGLKQRGLVAPTATWRGVCVSSFSAGFGAVRAILKVPAYFDRIDAMYLADTLYAGYVGEGPERKVDPDDVKDFCRFAAEAAAGRKTLIVTHSYLEPGPYAGTQETADNLIAAAGASRRAVSEAGPATMRIDSRADRGRFHVWGCEGKTGEDHMGHLRNMRFWYPNLPLERAAGGGA